ncbi:catalase family peroxidase [Chitinophaga tropicalis]|uniref:Catalase-related peroxidase n=1 Tax=Chitinophaga tropicalis TaxID=2683588 RepID=A0A7K1U647_9BACT|nr:catalase family peroxidase [Chitinophaga tropicalis]MVT09435.1 catalase [Chitinophaga tropicalis]
MSQQSQYIHSGEIVEKIGKILGYFPGFRSLHADGRLYRGVFKANEAAKLYTRAVHLQGDEIPVTVRFSKGGGDPYAHFSSTVGMATRFYLPDGCVTNLVMLSQKLFIARTVEQFMDLLEAGLPKEPGGPINKEGLQHFFAANPNSGAVFKMRAESLAPVSFAHTEFNAVHAFYFINAESRPTAVRCHWKPALGIKGQSPEVLAAQPTDILYTELTGRLANEPVHFDLELELAQEGDPLNDATVLWPENRQRVVIGRLTLTAPTTEEEIGDKVMNHDPSLLTDGIEPTDDPILQIRRGVYEVSAAHRSGGWRKCPFTGNTSAS